MKKLILLIVALVFMACDNTQNAESSTTNAESNAQSIESQSITTADSSDLANVSDSSNIATTKDSSDSSEAKTLTTNTAKPAQDLSTNANTANATTANATAKSPQDLYKKCIACHGTLGDKIPPGSVTKIVIADLDKKTLISDLKGYRAKTLSKGGTAAIMYLQVNGLSDEDIEILSQYISGFKK